jgi:thiamine pyrophosphokinase
MKVLIVANGAKPQKSILLSHASSTDMLIAADGGAYICLENGLKPDVIIGDMDSFNSMLKHSDLNIILNHDQETNDLEKALNHALFVGGTHISVLGATGARLDQTLKNISVMQQFHTSFDEIVFRDNFGWMKMIPKNYTFEVTPGTIISLFPVSGLAENIFTHGLKYPLKGESLQNGVRDGSSNEAISSSVTINYESGTLLLMVYDSLID